MARKADVVARILNEVAIGDQVVVALQMLQDQLRRGVPVVLPDVLRRALPAAEAGDRAKVMQWRSFVVWADWNGDDWDVAVELDGKTEVTTMPDTSKGFRPRYRLCGAPFTVQSLLFKDTETLTKGDLVNLETGEVDLAATNDTAILGKVMQWRSFVVWSEVSAHHRVGWRVDAAPETSARRPRAHYQRPVY